MRKIAIAFLLSALLSGCAKVVFMGKGENGFCVLCVDTR